MAVARLDLQCPHCGGKEWEAEKAFPRLVLKCARCATQLVYKLEQAIAPKPSSDGLNDLNGAKRLNGLNAASPHVGERK